jgi:myo-inositol 2-dehydrogenase/D-chiro-inositol 1-dehydrogenase
MRRRVRIGLAGLGRMGRIHAASLAARCPSAELACVFDADAGMAGQVAEQFGVDRADSYESILADGRVDAVAIATPTGTHAELAVQAAQAGKHVFCEKPISLDRQATVRVIDAVRAADRVFQVGFHRRFDPDWAAVAGRIRSGELGEVYLFRTSLRDMTPPKPEFLAGSGGFFVDCTIHDLDTARWLAGEVTEVTAHGSALSDPGFAEIGDVDTAVVVLRFENGALGVIDESRAAGYGYEASTEVVGSRATARIDDPYDRHYEWRIPGQATHGLPRDFEQRFGPAYANELEHFARCVRDGLAPEPSAADALAAFDLARAAEQSWREGRTVAVQAERTDDGVRYTVKQENR